MLENNIISSIPQVINNDCSFSSSSINLLTPPIKYSICDGILAGGAIIDHNSNFVINIGGLSNGFVIIKLSISVTKIYNLIIDYISNFIDSPLKIDVNNINTGTLYLFPKTDLIKSFTIPIFLKKGINEIKFYGDGINYGPNLKTAWISTINSTTDIYDLSEGNLINNAKVRLKTGFVYMLGGPKDGASILDINIKEDGIYSLSIDYLCGDCSRNLVIDINESVNSTYCFPKTTGWSTTDISKFSLYIKLNSGVNTLKFHGDGINYSPNLKKFSLKKLSCASTSNTTTICIPVNTLPIPPTISTPISTTIPTAPTTQTSLAATSSLPNISPSNDIFQNTLPTSLIPSIIPSKVNVSNTCNSIILNGSAFKKENFIEGIGGIHNGCVILIIEVPFKGYYDFAIPYVTTDNNKKIKLDINGINTGITYDFEKTLSLSPINKKVKIIKLFLIQGKNVIKVY